MNSSKRNQDEHTFTSFSKKEVIDGDKFRFSTAAAGYKFSHRPFEDKRVRQGAERERQLKREGGVIGEPRNSLERYVNKVFDHKRVKSIARNGK